MKHLTDINIFEGKNNSVDNLTMKLAVDIARGTKMEFDILKPKTRNLVADELCMHYLQNGNEYDDMDRQTFRRNKIQIIKNVVKELLTA